MSETARKTTAKLQPDRKKGKAIQKFQQFIRHNGFKLKMLRGIDWITLSLAILITLFGIICIFAATGTPTETQPATVLEMLETQSTFQAGKQLTWFFVSLVAMAATIFVNYTYLERWSTLIYWVNIVILIWVLGQEKLGLANTMSGWFLWGDGNSFQPSEIAKIAIIITLARWFASRKIKIHNLSGLFPSLILVGIPLLLIVLQPDFGTAMVYIAIFAIMLWASGCDWKMYLAIVALGAAAIIALWLVLRSLGSDNYRVMRILSLFDPSLDQDASRQVTNAKIAVGSAGLTGKGLFAEGSYAILNYVPQDHTDFIFAVVGETFGFVGAIGLVLCYAILLVRLLVLSSHAGNRFGCYLIIGIFSMLLFHIAENVMMVIGLMPVTGIPLPFVSYGGTNLLTNYIGIGLVLNVNMRAEALKNSETNKAPVPSI